MIDQEARKKIAESLRALASGLITNDEFENRLPLNSKDPAIRAIKDGAWQLYSDLRCYKLRDEHRLSKATKSELARWILFLQTDLPYEWQGTKGIKHFLLILSSLLTLGFSMKLYMRAYSKQGDFTLWPFIRTQDYESALSQPVYLSGNSI